MSQRATPLRRQVLMVIVGVAALAVMLFALPLAVAAQRLYHEETVTSLERDATRIAAFVPDTVANDPDPPKLPFKLSKGVKYGIYDLGGDRIWGDGPAHSPVTTKATDRGVHEAVEGGRLAVSAPVPTTHGITAVIRVFTPYERVSQRTERTWGLMAVLALIVIFLAGVYARAQARRLAGPLERLTEAAETLGGGDFSIRAQRSGVRETDAAGLALEATARRLGDVLERERAFSADVSHQLRTPLTGMLLGLESALTRPGADLKAAIKTALERGEHLQDIIDDLLELARDRRPAAEELDLTGLLDELHESWDSSLAEADRSLTTSVQGPLPPLHCSPSAVRQILDVLIDNAVRHGKGRIGISVLDLGSGVAIDVGDEGPGVSDVDEIFTRRVSSGNGHGIGLALARSLAEAENGRLVLRRPSPPVFTLLLPASREADEDQASSS